MFNLAEDRFITLNRRTDSKRTIKTAEALWRAAASTAFYCVEAYLNGLAFDYYTANEPRLDEDTKRLLTEWDTVQKRFKPVRLRDKLLQYPRIICGTAHPPLQENSCPEMAFFMGRAKLLRDAVVHASPKPNLSAVGDAKESLFLSLDFPETERIVDNTVALIRKIEIAVHGDESRIGWLCGRGPDGLFPDAAFD